MVCPMAWRKDLDKPLVALEFLAGFQGSAVAVACWSRPSVVRIPGTRHLGVMPRAGAPASFKGTGSPSRGGPAGMPRHAFSGGPAM